MNGSSSVVQRTFENFDYNDNNDSVIAYQVTSIEPLK